MIIKIMNIGNEDDAEEYKEVMEQKIKLFNNLDNRHQLIDSFIDQRETEIQHGDLEYQLYVRDEEKEKGHQMWKQIF